MDMETLSNELQEVQLPTPSLDSVTPENMETLTMTWSSSLARLDRSVREGGNVRRPCRFVEEAP
jgi:hypothetical protein